MSTARFHTTDGVEYVVPCDEGTTLLAAAEEAGHLLVSLCHHGACGVCRSRLVEGRVRMTEHSAGALSAADEQAGGILLCCGHAEGDVLIDLPYDSSRVGEGAVPERVVTIQSLDRWPAGVVRLVVKAEEDPELGSAIQFDSGQFAELTPPDGGRARAYSFASVANWDGTAEFYVKLREDGYFSDYLATRAKVGDRLTMRGPQGAFGLHENGPRPRWMVCGGTGLAPLMSMLRRMAEWGDTQQAVLVLGVNTPREVFATDELAELEAAMPSLRTVVTVVRPDEAWKGRVGTAVDAMDAELGARDPAGEAPDVYLCGPPGFLDAARACATSHGVPDDQIYEERI